MRLGPPEIPEKGRALLGFYTHPTRPSLYHKGKSHVDPSSLSLLRYFNFDWTVLLPGALVPQIFVMVPSCPLGLSSNVTYFKRSSLTSQSKAAFTQISSLSTPLFCFCPLT